MSTVPGMPGPPFNRLHDIEFRDGTTGLFNRRSFDIVLDMELEKARRSQDKIRAVMLVEITGMREVTARHGDQIADLLLETSGIRVKEALRGGDYVFRYEGDVFAVILSSLKRDTDIPYVAERVTQAIGQPFRRDGNEIRFGARIGAALSPSDAEEGKSLLSSAFAALEDATRTGNNLAIFDSELYRKAMARYEARSDVRRAVVEEEFELYFQPIVDARYRPVGAESLIRWNHPTRGLVLPSEFVPLAEESGDIRTIGRWVAYQACARLRDWSADCPWLYISVNLSPAEFEDEDFLQRLADTVEPVAQATGGRIKLEITETQGIADFDGMVRKMRLLAARGLDVMIDDFGTGYSSLSWLKLLPAEVIKIDKSFVHGIEDGGDDLDFLRGMVDMIHSRGKKVLVEGVDSERKRDLLVGLGADLLQGYLFARPLRSHDLLDLVKDRSPLPREASRREGNP